MQRRLSTVLAFALLAAALPVSAHAQLGDLRAKAKAARSSGIEPR